MLLLIKAQPSCTFGEPVVFTEGRQTLLTPTRLIHPWQVPSPSQSTPHRECPPESVKVPTSTQCLWPSLMQSCTLIFWLLTQGDLLHCPCLFPPFSRVSPFSTEAIQPQPTGTHRHTAVLLIDLVKSFGSVSSFRHTYIIVFFFMVWCCRQTCRHMDKCHFCPQQNVLRWFFGQLKTHADENCIRGDLMCSVPSAMHACACVCVVH